MKMTVKKSEKKYKIIATKYSTGQTYESCIGTLQELIKYYSYTLEVGESWQDEKGNRKINRNPKSIQALVNNLRWAKDNAAQNGYGGMSYEFEEITEEVQKELQESQRCSENKIHVDSFVRDLQSVLEKYNATLVRSATEGVLTLSVKCPDNSFSDLEFKEEISARDLNITKG